MKSLSPRPVSLAAQLMRLQRRFPDGTGGIFRSRLTWELAIQPHALAHTYHCQLEHKLQDYPKVYCLEPALSVLAAGRKLPHVYCRTEPICMCLFMRRRECWNDSMNLADLVVPLTFFWLANFEEWLYSGVWRGGGTHETKCEAPTSVPLFPGELAYP
jgi:hypothetical protein